MNWHQVYINLLTIFGYGFLAVLIYLIYKYFIKSQKQTDLDNKFIIITGGSSGIGKEVAIIAAKRGANVAIIARNSKKLAEAKDEILSACKNAEKQKIECVSLDITANYNEVEKAIAELENKVGSISMLVNCAGLAICGKIDEMPIESLKQLNDTNFLATYYCTKAVVPKMKREREGNIVIVSSLAGLLGIFGYTAYSSTKFALRGFAESLAMELSPYNIKVTLSTPPDTDTPGLVLEEKTKPTETKLISETAGLFKAETVAEKLLDDALNGKFFSTNGMDGFLLTTLSAGMSPYTSVTELIIQAVLMGPFRIIGAFYLYSFKKVILQCMKNREQFKKAE